MAATPSPPTRYIDAATACIYLPTLAILRALIALAPSPDLSQFVHQLATPLTAFPRRAHLVLLSYTCLTPSSQGRRVPLQECNKPVLRRAIQTRQSPFPRRARRALMQPVVANTTAPILDDISHRRICAVTMGSIRHSRRLGSRSNIPRAQRHD